jgi:hypothetical protein
MLPRTVCCAEIHKRLLNHPINIPLGEDHFDVLIALKCDTMHGVKALVIMAEQGLLWTHPASDD